MFHLTTALDAASAVPLYEQLYQSLAAEMRAGAIPAGTRMPGKRRLAAELSVSVNTVDAAYQILAAEGYLEPKERSGFYVQEYLALPPRPERAPGTPAKPMEPEAPAGEAAPPSPPVRYDLSTRGVDPALFPFRTWARLQRSCSLLAGAADPRRCSGRLGAAAGAGGLSGRIPGRAVLAPADRGGSRPGIPAGPAGPAAARQSRRGDPGYPRAKQVLENNGVECCCLPVDEDGLSIEELSRSGASVCYVTPQPPVPYRRHHAGRPPAELLHWAAKRPGERYIIEDDYDSEFRFDTRPLPSLQGMAGPTARWSTFPPAPGAWPPASVSPIWCCRSTCCPPGGRPTASMPARWAGLSSRRWPGSSPRGIFTRHLARERVAYKARRDALTAALNAAFAPGQLRLAGLHTGLHLLASLKNAPPDEALRRAAEAEGCG